MSNRRTYQQIERDIDQLKDTISGKRNHMGVLRERRHGLLDEKDKVNRELERNEEEIQRCETLIAEYQRQLDKQDRYTACVRCDMTLIRCKHHDGRWRNGIDLNPEELGRKDLLSGLLCITCDMTTISYQRPYL